MFSCDFFEILTLIRLGLLKVVISGGVRGEAVSV